MNQREIKFRAWDKKELYMNKIESFPSMMSKEPIPQYQIENMVFLQYTGLKDKNGKPIYEGDIINAETELKGDSQNLIVVYNPEYVGFTLTNHSQTDGAYLMNCEFWAEVIGNVYENPELLTTSQP